MIPIHSTKAAIGATMSQDASSAYLATTRSQIQTQASSHALHVTLMTLTPSMMASPTHKDAHSALVNRHLQIVSSAMLAFLEVFQIQIVVNSSAILDSTRWLFIRVGPYPRMCLRARLVNLVIRLADRV